MCLKGYTTEAEAALNSSKIDEGEKERWRTLLRECGTNPLNYIEPAEGKIVGI